MRATEAGKLGVLERVMWQDLSSEVFPKTRGRRDENRRQGGAVEGAETCPGRWQEPVFKEWLWGWRHRGRAMAPWRQGQGGVIVTLKVLTLQPSRYSWISTGDALGQRQMATSWSWVSGRDCISPQNSSPTSPQRLVQSYLLSRCSVTQESRSKW